MWRREFNRTWEESLAQKQAEEEEAQKEAPERSRSRLGLVFKVFLVLFGFSWVFNGSGSFLMLFIVFSMAFFGFTKVLNNCHYF